MKNIERQTTVDDASKNHKLAFKEILGNLVQWLSAFDF